LKPIPYTPDAIQTSLKTLILGHRIELHQQVGSTNDLAREAGRRGEAEGLVILAEEQLAGRGRLGRTWVAPHGCCVLCSVLLRPRFSPEHAFYLTIAAALAIHRACAALLNQQAKHPGLHHNNSKLKTQNSKLAIKWPNDVLVNGRKVCGILSESEFVGGEWAFAVVGFGINANLNPGELGGLRDSATSLSAELGHDVGRAALLVRVLTELESIYLSLQGGQTSTVYREWVATLETTGRRVMVHAPEGILTGQALRVEPDGALVLRLDSGEERRVLAGDVMLPG
jgi:BirA family biotin operon repressor/biotin-[acetyl-CoA-carboxylase] ligase